MSRFFDSVPYFSPQHLVTASKIIPLPLSMSLTAPLPTLAPADSSPVPLLDTSKPPASNPVRDDTSTLVTKRFLPLNQFQPTLLKTVLLLNHQCLPLTLISSLPFVNVTDLSLIILFQSLFPMIILTPPFVSLLHPCLLSIYPSLLRRLYWYLRGSKPWWRDGRSCL